MFRLVQLLAGPELLWALIYTGVIWFARLNTPPTQAIDAFILRLWVIIPVFVILTFALWYMPVVEKTGLLLRVWIACLLGAHFALEKGLGAYSEQGPGIGTAYIAGMLFAFVCLIAGSVFVAIRF